jgi:ubiquinone/menaquinone biosynthesis C-methylase UbiE
MSHETMKNHFARLARSYDELRNPDKALAERVEMLVAIGDLRGCHTLDIGCGTGRILSMLARDYRVHGWGIDASSEMLAIARAKLPEHINVQQATAESLPFPDQFFERAYMTMVVHLLDRPRAFAEISRVLQPGGRFTIITTNPDSLAESLAGLPLPILPQDRFRPLPIRENPRTGTGRERLHQLSASYCQLCPLLQ